MQALILPRKSPSPLHPSQAQGTKCTFYKGVERQGAPTGLVFSFHHHHHVKAVAGEVLTLQDDDGDDGDDGDDDGGMMTTVVITS